MKTLTLHIFFLLIVFSCGKREEAQTETTQKDPLPSWNEGEVKSAIINYVTRVTKEGSSDLIPVKDRIATFDNDGTLWAERPYVQELFAFFQVKKITDKNPALKNKQPYKAVLEQNKAFMEKGGEKFLIELMIATHTGMSENEFDQSVKDFFSTAIFPGKKVPVKQIRYQPQLELLDYLRANNFKIYICTGGTVEFVRGISEDFYGVPVEQVIGTSFKYVFADSSREVYRQSVLNHFDDKTGKPVAIQLAIGKHPVLTCGNEGGEGDIAMSKFSQAGKYPSLQLIVNHDDEAREFLYSESDSASLKEAAKNKWRVISMKNDWKKIFPDN